MASRREKEGKFAHGRKEGIKRIKNDKEKRGKRKRKRDDGKSTTALYIILLLFIIITTCSLTIYYVRNKKYHEKLAE